VSRGKNEINKEVERNFQRKGKNRQTSKFSKDGRGNWPWFHVPKTLEKGTFWANLQTHTSNWVAVKHWLEIRALASF
jgi:hypothetical protein